MKKPTLVLAIIVAIVVIVAAAAYVKFISPHAVSAKVVAADNRDYFPIVHNLLAGAQRSIEVIIYQGRFYFQYPLSSSNTLIADLADASQRGVKVRAVIDEADWNPENSEENHDVSTVLSQAGIATYFDPLETTSHSKMVVVDGRYSVVGSMNWNYYALDRNNEATTIVDSPVIGKQFEAYFDNLVKACSPAYRLPDHYLTASEAVGAKSRTVFVKDLADSGKYLPDARAGLLYMGNVVVRADSDALNEILALDSLFFAGAAKETVRVFAEVEKGGGRELHALDLETDATKSEMARALGIERSKLKTTSVPTPSFAWTSASRVEPIPNDKYQPAVSKLFQSAKKRIWIAVMDARFYDTRPVPPSRDKRKGKGGPPSVTNLMLDDLEQAVGRGVDVQLICDNGRGGSQPNNKLAFMKKLHDAGGKVFWDSPDITTHAKVAIVDDDWVVVGSANWTEPGMEENNETSILVESPELNQHYATYITSIKGQEADLRPIGAGGGGQAGGGGGGGGGD
ncbi:MAG TPA: phospholipase D-like domain-containing protein [bacterium]|nr:phospholipase D-like domain-containing protein [bacterium]